jgi:hypothetical protein
MPRLPVQALAFPELTTIAWARPFLTRGKQTFTGAAQIWFDVAENPCGQEPLRREDGVREDLELLSHLPPVFVPAAEETRNSFLKGGASDRVLEIASEGLQESICSVSR